MNDKRRSVFVLTIVTVILAGVCVVFPLYADDPVGSMLEGVGIGEAIEYDNCTIFPLTLDRPVTGSRLLNLDEALEKGVLDVKEYEGGNVPRVIASNTSGSFVFIMGGEVLTGCKQDRIVGRDILIPPYTKGIEVSVYCVEAGRWDDESEGFYSKKNAGTYNLRSLAQEADGGAQSKIWGEVSGMNEAMGVETDTNAYQDAYEKKENALIIEGTGGIIKTIEAIGPEVCGIAIGVGKRIVSVDVFSDHALFRKLMPKLLAASVLAGIAGGDGERTAKAEAETFMAALMKKEYRERDAAAAGREWYTFDESLTACALVFDKTAVHLAAFPAIKRNGTDEEVRQDWNVEQNAWF